MKIITLNLNGIRAACRKGFLEWIQLQQPDYICLQELKAQEADLTLEILKPEGYEGFFSYAQKRGYSGVGVYTKNTPLEYKTKMGIPSIDDEGRYIELNFKNFSILSLYLPSGSSGDERQNYKYKVLGDIKLLMDEKLSQNQYVVVCGDFNIAHQEIDIKNYKGNRNNSGFLPQERDWLTNLFKQGWIDVYRKLYPDTKEECYTWWSNRGQAWLKNVGWRIDYQIANQALANKSVRCNIFKDQRFSDHAPLIVNYEALD